MTTFSPGEDLGHTKTSFSLKKPDQGQKSKTAAALFFSGQNCHFGLFSLVEYFLGSSCRLKLKN